MAHEGNYVLRILATVGNGNDFVVTLQTVCADAIYIFILFLFPSLIDFLFLRHSWCLVEFVVDLQTFLLNLVPIQMHHCVVSGGAFYPSMPRMSPTAVKVTSGEQT